MKDKIPKALREQVWIRHCGTTFEHKCMTRWCQNKMTVFDFHVGHNIPESRGGPTILNNLVPLCSRCNTSMGNQYTIDEWNKMYADVSPPKGCCWSARPEVPQPVVRSDPPPLRIRTPKRGRSVEPDSKAKPLVAQPGA